VKYLTKEGDEIPQAPCGEVYPNTSELFANFTELADFICPDTENLEMI
jgi:hypothetical protein